MTPVSTHAAVKEPKNTTAMTPPPPPPWVTSPKVKVLEDTPCQETLSIEISAADVDKETEAAYEAIRHNATLPGFRAGKAPLELVKQSFSDSARRRVVDRLLGRAVQHVLRERKFRLVADPQVDKVHREFGRPFSFQLTVEKVPTFPLKDYKHIKVTQKARHVTDERVETALDALQERNAQLALAAEETVRREHFAVVDYAGTVDGQAITGGSAQNVLVEMASPQLISGLAEGILGMRRGEEKTVPIQFPDSHPEQTLAGKSAVFTVTVKEIKEKRLPPLDDELAKDLGASSLEELQQRIHAALQKQDEQDSQKEQEDQLVEHLLKVHPFPVPSSLVVHRAETLLSKMEQAFAPRQQAGTLTEAQRAEWRERFRPEAERQVRLSFILQAIAEAEHLEVSDDEFRATVEASVAAQPDQRAAIERSLAERRERILAALQEEKIFRFLKDHARLSVEKPPVAASAEPNEQLSQGGKEKPKGLRRLFSAFKKSS